MKSKGTFDQKERIIKRLNERIASIVRKVGINNEEYNRWAAKLSRANSPYATKINKYDPANVKLEKNKGILGALSFIQLSRKKADIEAMNLSDLERLEDQTRGWGAVRKEAKQALKEQRKKQAEYNPFTREIEKTAPVTDEEIVGYINQKEEVRQFIEGNTDAFYALIESTGWDDIRDHTTEEIYNEVSKLDMSTYQFSHTLSEIGESYKARRDASRARRRSLGI